MTLVRRGDTSSLAYRRGVRRAIEALAARPAEAPRVDLLCRFGAGLDCLDGDTCPNPNHRGAPTR